MDLVSLFCFITQLLYMFHLIFWLIVAQVKQVYLYTNSNKAIQSTVVYMMKTYNKKSIKHYIAET